MKENFPFVQLCINHLNESTVKQYQSEERSLISRRIKTSTYRVNQLLEVMLKEDLSTPEKVETLRTELANHYRNNDFMSCESMGELMKLSLNLLVDKLN